MTDLEAAVLNGSLFNPDRTTSPARSISPSLTDTDDELGSDLSDTRDHSRSHFESSSLAVSDSHDPQTGPKGVISDRHAHDRNAKYEKNRAIQNVRDLQEKIKMVALTADEEDVSRQDEEARLIQAEKREGMEKEDEEYDEKFKEQWKALRRDQLKMDRNGSGVAKRGLREIGQEGFIHAVERPGWVIILIYEPGIPRCSALLASMLQLSLAEPPLPVTLFRARATSLSFALLPPSSGGENGSEDRRADFEVLPSLLAYKDGELEKTWIRVDWDLKEDGVAGLLRREGILPRLDSRRHSHMLSDEDDEEEDDD
ncbi:hypothetical protein BD324DRAFT_647906 [Kockovaella imperatae]|uniref:Phosducin domain-containing protein n=1 Tax=Kockovaella imperatae TaxID=4999 RepID=A0A1Y1UU98_9TREE|nr:hypothetical protein BD324DRAFT_647906 [Kockovaella imperatae]ORX41006.1 hypothetical protein BD324DRAFT_647906 [Kockovaella imperatae]